VARPKRLSARSASDSNLPVRELRAAWEGHPPGQGAAETVHGCLRAAVIGGLLQPGTPLREDELAQLFQVSRTPVREAMLRLEAEHLAHRLARRGMVVSEVTPDEILEIYMVRATLDGLSARLAAASASPLELDQLRSINRQLRTLAEAGEYDRMSTLNLRFHELIAHASRNTALATFISEIHDRIRRFPGSSTSRGKRAIDALDEHDAIIDAIEARDAEAAERAARVHLERAMEVRVAMIHEIRLAAS
jgi:DNA-binding GntR family transcriptional regulator